MSESKLHANSTSQPSSSSSFGNRSPSSSWIGARNNKPAARPDNPVSLSMSRENSAGSMSMAAGADSPASASPKRPGHRRTPSAQSLPLISPRKAVQRLGQMVKGRSSQSFENTSAGALPRLSLSRGPRPRSISSPRLVDFSRDALIKTALEVVREIHLATMEQGTEMFVTKITDKGRVKQIGSKAAAKQQEGVKLQHLVVTLPLNHRELVFTHPEVEEALATVAIGSITSVQSGNQTTVKPKKEEFDNECAITVKVKVFKGKDKEKEKEKEKERDETLLLGLSDSKTHSAWLDGLRVLIGTLNDMNTVETKNEVGTLVDLQEECVTIAKERKMYTPSIPPPPPDFNFVHPFQHSSATADGRRGRSNALS